MRKHLMLIGGKGVAPSSGAWFVQEKSVWIGTSGTVANPFIVR